uniref:Phorbol-ester/DAG-type domain-containing protein n=1 Tax=Bos indicus x Bos taurus TaxID=30522 RepID=A0A4W2EQN1_BOBOX
MAAAAEPGARGWLGGGSPRPGSPTSSPELGAGSRSRSGPGSGPGSGPERSGSRPPGPAAPSHSFRKVTLTKPTFCHLCSDFIWGLAGILCDVCNFMSHEKCLKHVKTPCTSVAPSLVRVPVAHCFGPRGLYKRRFCSVCRKGLEAPGLRCEATAASATRTGTAITTRTSTTGGRGPCRPARVASSVGRLAAPRTCRPACAASGAASRPTRSAPRRSPPSALSGACAPWSCPPPACASCPETSARCTAFGSPRARRRSPRTGRTAPTAASPLARAERWGRLSPVSAPWLLPLPHPEPDSPDRPSLHGLARTPLRPRQADSEDL